MSSQTARGKVTWTADVDRKVRYFAELAQKNFTEGRTNNGPHSQHPYLQLLVLCFGRQITAADHEPLAQIFNCTPRAIAERIKKFNKEHREAAAALDEGVGTSATAANTPAKQTSNASTPVKQTSNCSMKTAPGGSRKAHGADNVDDNDDDGSEAEDTAPKKKQRTNTNTPKAKPQRTESPTLDGTGRSPIKYEVEDDGKISFDFADMTPASPRAYRSTPSPLKTSMILEDVDSAGVRFSATPTRRLGSVAPKSKTGSVAATRTPTPGTARAKEVLASPLVNPRTFSREKRKLEHDAAEAFESEYAADGDAGDMMPHDHRVSKLKPAKKLRRSEVFEPSEEMHEYGRSKPMVNIAAILEDEQDEV
ncbi:hypothetical protein K402DRAFT_425634 [Aulographum hederae CBS 113979]|uniref:Uncharacterized protein n=1 Tax=Aulographum hederae CBS 113979 TaxID=1176131 RepID=A0A6G1GK32_9PEZI|nr:hypothetical protein K402DRAFT_425634 [Aulographum hederae CBS 113979]